eukprot:m.1219142 g.1219142  ORF g.1219142 m.1219142 type:complete len:743 (+) comp24620_c0_seq26:393-2621(+)
MDEHQGGHKPTQPLLWDVLSDTNPIRTWASVYEEVSIQLLETLHRDVVQLLLAQDDSRGMNLTPGSAFVHQPRKINGSIGERLSQGAHPATLGVDPASGTKSSAPNEATCVQVLVQPNATMKASAIKQRGKKHQRHQKLGTPVLFQIPNLRGNAPETTRQRRVHGPPTRVTPASKQQGNLMKLYDDSEFPGLTCTLGNHQSNDGNRNLHSNESASRQHDSTMQFHDDKEFPGLTAAPRKHRSDHAKHQYHTHWDGNSRSERHAGQLDPSVTRTSATTSSAPLTPKTRAETDVSVGGEGKIPDTGHESLGVITRAAILLACLLTDGFVLPRLPTLHMLLQCLCLPQTAGANAADSARTLGVPSTIAAAKAHPRLLKTCAHALHFATAVLRHHACAAMVVDVLGPASAQIVLRACGATAGSVDVSTVLTVLGKQLLHHHGAGETAGVSTGGDDDAVGKQSADTPHAATTAPARPVSSNPLSHEGFQTAESSVSQQKYFQEMKLEDTFTHMMRDFRFEHDDAKVIRRSQEFFQNCRATDRLLLPRIVTRQVIQVAAEGFVFGADADKRNRLDMRMAGRNASGNASGAHSTPSGDAPATHTGTDPTREDLFVTSIDSRSFHDMLLVASLDPMSYFLVPCPAAHVCVWMGGWLCRKSSVSRRVRVAFAGPSGAGARPRGGVVSGPTSATWQRPSSRWGRARDVRPDAANHACARSHAWGCRFSQAQRCCGYILWRCTAVLLTDCRSD